MARSKRSLSTNTAKEVSKEINSLIGTDYRYNFDYMRLIEMVLCQRVVEQVCAYKDEDEICTKTVTIEIPLIGNLTIQPRVFHEQHGMSNKPSIHFEFEFVPTNAFKSDVITAYTRHESPIPEYFSELYGKEIKEIYNRMRLGD